jgi:uncharacterized protein
LVRAATAASGLRTAGTIGVMEEGADLLDGTPQGLDGRVAIIWALTAASIPVIGALIGAVALGASGAGGIWVGVVVLTAAVLTGVAVAWARASWARWSWSARPDALDLKHGVIVARESLVPYHRIQQIDVVRDPLERMLGLSSLVLRTASASSDGKIPGLPATVAEGLRLRLLTKAGVDDAV